MREVKYYRQKAIQYAEKWAFSRNPKYHNFDAVGGDCTNFISQCLYEGCKVMNYTKDVGWYYKLDLFILRGQENSIWTNENIFEIL